jgi:hypothetical protein
VIGAAAAGVMALGAQTAAAEVVKYDTELTLTKEWQPRGKEWRPRGKEWRPRGKEWRPRGKEWRPRGLYHGWVIRSAPRADERRRGARIELRRASDVPSLYRRVGAFWCQPAPSLASSGGQARGHDTKEPEIRAHGREGRHG